MPRILVIRRPLNSHRAKDILDPSLPGLKDRSDRELTARRS